MHLFDLLIAGVWGAGIYGLIAQWFEIRRARQAIAEGHAREADYVSRLMARSHAEYAAFASPPEPAKTYADGEVIYDATGLVEVQLEREDDRVG